MNPQKSGKPDIPTIIAMHCKRLASHARDGRGRIAVGFVEFKFHALLASLIIGTRSFDALSHQLAMLPEEGPEPVESKRKYLRQHNDTATIAYRTVSTREHHSALFFPAFVLVVL